VKRPTGWSQPGLGRRVGQPQTSGGPTVTASGSWNGKSVRPASHRQRSGVVAANVQPTAGGPHRALPVPAVVTRPRAFMGRWARLVLLSVRVGLRQQAALFAVAAACFVLIDSLALRAVRGAGDGGRPAWLNYLVFAIQGCPPSAGGAEGTGFELPIVWLVCQIVVLLMVGAEPTQESDTYVVQVLCRVGSRTTWWLARVAWMLLSVAAFYLIGALVAAVFVGLTGTSGEWVNPAVALSVNRLDVTRLDWWQLGALVALGPVVSVVLSSVQLALAALGRPLLGLGATLVYVLVSSWAMHPVLIAQYSMIWRNRLVNRHGLPTSTMLWVCLGVIVTAVTLGAWVVHRRDVLGPAGD